AQGSHQPRERAEGRARIPGAPRGPVARPKVPHRHGDAAVPGLPVPAPRPGHHGHSASHPGSTGREPAGQGHGTHDPSPRSVRAAPPATAQPGAAMVSNGAAGGGAAIPGLPAPSAARQGRGPSEGPPAAPTGVLSAPSRGSGAPGHTAGPYGRHYPTAPMAPG